MAVAGRNRKYHRSKACRAIVALPRPAHNPASPIRASLTQAPRINLPTARRRVIISGNTHHKSWHSVARPGCLIIIGNFADIEHTDPCPLFKGRAPQEKKT
jgi:hypothetical protein